MRSYVIRPVEERLRKSLQQKIDAKTKPLGALGMLEDVALQIGLIQNTLSPVLTKPHLLVFAGDHGIVEESVSAYRQEVTRQMVFNFLKDGAAINVFCKQHNIELKVVDAGVNFDFPKETPGLIHNKAAKGTMNFLNAPAMTIKQAQSCIDTSANLVKEISATGCDIIGFGEMGIGNTSSASVITSLLCKVPIEKCVGRGTGLNDRGLVHKVDLLKKAIAFRGKQTTPLKTLATFGGFEIAQMVGAMLQAAELKMVILIDGFIATTAFLVAHEIEPAIKAYAIFCHQSAEGGHPFALNHLQVKPLLNLNMRLGEGTGVAVAYPIVQSAVNFLTEMASFESAAVSEKL
jgi:nicotinate-nucleotide--dimethylbenzimidazole phosphoribosyltransferase